MKEIISINILNVSVPEQLKIYQLICIGIIQMKNIKNLLQIFMIFSNVILMSWIVSIISISPSLEPFLSYIEVIVVSSDKICSTFSRSIPK